MLLLLSRFTMLTVWQMCVSRPDVLQLSAAEAQCLSNCSASSFDATMITANRVASSLERLGL
jgi:hypothetical protein